MEEINDLKCQIEAAIRGLLAAADLKPGKIVVLGGSTSEVLGEKIGSASNLAIGRIILAGILPLIREKNLYLAVQCCEHLNRALVVEESCAERYHLEIVSAIPYEKAGGALAAAAMEDFVTPVLVETIAADAGLDIGDTFIGMHLRRVAIPVRLPIKMIGRARLTLAMTRPKLIGGERTRYKR